MRRTQDKRAIAWAPLTAALALAACGPIEQLDARNPVDRTQLGWPVMSLRWSVELADRAEDSKPQEFASPAALAASDPDGDRLFVGSHEGMFFALEARTGEILWKKKLGSTSSRPVLAPDSKLLYVGTDDGHAIALDPKNGAEKWRYATRGPVLESPVLSGDLLILSNEADQVYALDRVSGKFRWQYKSETPEEFTLRGHAGVAVQGDLVFTGFSNGTLVALRVATGSVAWLTSVKGDATRFVDMDATPAVVGEGVFAVSSAGGVYAVDRTTGLIRWRQPLLGAGALSTDGQRLYVAAADEGVYAIDLAGNIVWRQGTRGGGEPAGPVVSGEYLLYALSEAGLYVANKHTGQVYQYFDPGYGVSSLPTLSRDRMYVMSNSAVLYAMTLRRF
ncbi:MAG TPA: PQQ-binding-like beta-propeller repeat protein [Kofleriaceae bacterium]|nr:PQQ-binding-like beta-propeller repeat protein [Kofleriaceae bacterium]